MAGPCRPSDGRLRTPVPCELVPVSVNDREGGHGPVGRKRYERTLWPGPGNHRRSVASALDVFAEVEDGLCQGGDVGLGDGLGAEQHGLQRLEGGVLGLVRMWGAARFDETPGCGGLNHNRRC